MEEVGLISAFVAGVISFLSPCVLPIIPAYISYITGSSTVSDKEKINLEAFLNAIFFVLGFSIVFIILGASASFVGQLFRSNSYEISKIGGAIVVFFGFHFAGFFIRKNFLKEYLGLGALLLSLFSFKLISKDMFFDIAGIYLFVLFLYFIGLHEVLYRQLKIESSNKALGNKTGFLKYFSSLVVGISFAFGWSPCIGPVLGSILLYASQSGTVLKGVVLLALYSVGLGIPFLIGGLLIGYLLKFVKSFGKFFEVVEIAGGLLLIIMGVLLATHNLTLVSSLF